MTGQELRSRRVAAGLPGRLVCAQARVDRSRLSDIEREYVQPSAEEAKRLKAAIDQLTAAKRKLADVAKQCGWPVSAIGERYRPDRFRAVIEASVAGFKTRRKTRMKPVS